MAEANASVHQAHVRASLERATITLARRAAIKATKAELHAQGLRPTHYPTPPDRCPIKADEYLAAPSSRANRRSEADR